MNLSEVLRPYNPEHHRKDLGYRRWNVVVNYMFMEHEYWMRTTVSARDRREAQRLAVAILHRDYDNAHGGAIQTKSVQAETPLEKRVGTVRTVADSGKKKK